MWKLQIQWWKVVFINLATKLESSWSHQCDFSVYIQSLYNLILLWYNNKWKKGSFTDFTIKDSIFILKWNYEFVKNVEVWQLAFSKIFQTIFRDNYVASSHFASPWNFTKFIWALQNAQIPRGKVVLQCCLHFCLGSGI